MTEYQINTVRKYLKCQDLTKGFGVVSCPNCKTTYIVPFSCKKHQICPSCGMKRLLEYSAWLEQEVLLDLTHRHWVFTMPKEIRRYFLFNRFLLNKLLETACKCLVFLYRKYSFLPLEYKKIAHPGIIGVLQTNGSNLNWNPHVHIISTDGVLVEQENGDMIYRTISFIPYDYIRIAWRNRVLNMLFNFKIITAQQRNEIKKRYPKGFNCHGVLKDTMHDRDLKVRLCEYMIRNLISLKNIVSYSRDKKFVVIRYKYDNKFLNEKLNVYEFIARIVQHIDSQTIHTRYYGIYSNTLRHKWRKEGRKPNIKSKGIDKKDYKKKWAELIWQIYEVDPLICINCGARMKLKFLVDKNAARQYLGKIKKMKHYYQGRWSNHAPPRLYAA